MTNLDAARTFLIKIQENKELQKQLTLVDWDENTTVRIAYDLGFEFSVEDLLTAIDEQYSELSDEELATMTGGWSMPPTM